MRLLGHELGGLGLLVELDGDHPRTVVDPRRGAVVEDHQIAVGQPARVVLPGHQRALAHLERRLGAAEAPDELRRRAIDLVDAPGVARREQEVAVFIDVDRVQVQVVVLAALLRRDRRLALVEPDAVDRVPLEQHEAGLDVDLLHDAGDHDAAARAAERAQVLDHAVIGHQQGGALRRDRELVQVHRVAVGGADRRHAAVALVVDHPRPAAVADDQAALPPGDAPACPCRSGRAGRPRPGPWASS